MQGSKTIIRRTATLASGTASKTIVLNWASDADLKDVNEIDVHLLDFFTATVSVLYLYRAVAITSVGGGVPIPGYTWAYGQSVVTIPGQRPLRFHRRDGNVTFTFTTNGNVAGDVTVYAYGEVIG